MAHEVTHGTGPLLVVEGLTRSYAVAERGKASVSYAGCYSWQKDGEPVPCFDHVNLNRVVYDVPDADARTNAHVQEAQARRVKYLESRGATVLVINVPEVNGDEHAGLDDYLAAGGDLEALMQDAQPFTPTSVGRERLKRSDRLRIGVGILRGRVESLESRNARECSALVVARYAVEEAATSHGKPEERGVRVRPSVRQIAQGVRVSIRTVSKALTYLEEIGFLERIQGPRGKHEAASYLLLYPSLGGGREVGKHQGTKREQGKETLEHGGEGESPLYQQESSSGVYSVRGGREPGNVPALRNPKVVHTWEREDGRRVVVDSHYYWRYGKKREEILRYVLEIGDADETDIHERFGSRSSRLRDFRRTWITPMVDDGVLVTDDGIIRPAPYWADALERVRDRTGEEQDNRLQDQKYAQQSRAYREARNNPTDPTPDLAGRERAKRIVAEAEKRDHAAQVEEQRHKVGMTADVFLADTLQDVSGFGWRELGDLWRVKGGRTDDLRRAVRRGPYRLYRVYDGGPLYVEKREPKSEPEPEREPAPVTVLREPEPVQRHRTGPQLRDGIHHHGPFCDCEWCDTPLPTRYASAYAGSAS
jgi:DNA-binding MarR family transcriptional regulator